MSISQHCECLEKIRADYDVERKVLLQKINDISNEAQDINKKVIVIEGKLLELQETHECEYCNIRTRPCILGEMYKRLSDELMDISERHIALSGDIGDYNEQIRILKQEKELGEVYHHDCIKKLRE